MAGMRFALVPVIPLLALALPVSADEVPPEIDFLLTAIGASDCAFIRNDKRYTSEDAEDHLRMKYRRGKRHAPTTEAFIDRLASKSSISRKAYMIDCPGEDLVPTGEWLTQRLAEYREQLEDPAE